MSNLCNRNPNSSIRYCLRITGNPRVLTPSANTSARWSPPWLAFDIYRTAGLVNEAVHLTETQTATGANLLCRHKRIEDPGQDFRLDPRPGIGDLDCHVAAGNAEAIVMQRLVLRRNTEQAAAGHRVAGVEAEI
jgi:hypothetical protein